MTEYGLPTPRDSDGDLKAVDHTYEWDGQDVTIRLIPPTISQQEEYESLGADTGAEELESIVDEHLIKPNTSEMDLTARELLCYVEGIVDYSTGDAAGVAGEVREEIEQRQDSSGN